MCVIKPQIKIYTFNVNNKPLWFLIFQTIMLIIGLSRVLININFLMENIFFPPSPRRTWKHPGMSQSGVQVRLLKGCGPQATG